LDTTDPDCGLSSDLVPPAGLSRWNSDVAFRWSDETIASRMPDMRLHMKIVLRLFRNIS
jgi:hypothetical protein